MKARDWELLRKLRGQFLSAHEGLEEYWESEAQIELYDRFFAPRIGWKWDAVLADLNQRGWKPPGSKIVDWGCGTGVAARRFLEVWPETREVELWDRSAKAREYARAKLLATHPGIAVTLSSPRSGPGGTWLLSHVLNELPSPVLDTLMETLIEKADAVLWIEPGTHEVSRRLGAVRERLRGTFSLVAPCPHQNVCGMFSPENERHWCHHFATPPSEVFQDAEWSAFSRELEIDIRSVPYSHLVLDRHEVPAGPTERLIGRPRMYKGYARLLTCTAAGVEEKTLQKRDDPARFKELKKG